MTANAPHPPAAPDGTIEEVEGRYVLRFERLLAHPVERVWDAITNPERISQWTGGETKVELDLVEGGRFETRTDGPPELVEAIIRESGKQDLVAHDVVLRVEPPFLFEHTFGGEPTSVARWELHREGDGCRLVLTHIEPPEFDAANAPRDLGGWHTLLDLLAATLDGRPQEWTNRHWEGHRDRYAAALTG